PRRRCRPGNRNRRSQRQCTRMARSFSGQFLVRGLSTPTRTAPAPATTNQHLIRLESTLVAVSCERIKQLIYHELGVGTAWRGKVFLSLYPAQTTDQSVTIVSEKFRDGWQSGKLCLSKLGAALLDGGV